MQSIAAIQQQRISFERSQALSEAARNLLDKLLGSSDDDVTRPHRFKRSAQRERTNLSSTVHDIKPKLSFRKGDKDSLPARQLTTSMPSRRIVPSFRWSSVDDAGTVRFFVVPNSQPSNSSPTEIHGVGDVEDRR